MEQQKILELRKLANDIRIDIVNAAYTAGKNGCHLGGCLSMAEMLSVLYSEFIHFDKKNIDSRDRVIMSKGHGALALYATLHHRGLVSDDDLASFEHNGSEFTAHAHRNIYQGFEYTGGSLGLGMTFATGVAYACKLKGMNNRVYCFLGDGEMNEGVIWESMMFANQKHLSNLTIVIDYNHLQIGGNCEDIINLSPLADKLQAFGFSVISVDGHNVEELYNAYSTVSAERPNAIIAETVKGKGLKLTENKYKWHFGVLTEEKYKKAMEQLGVTLD